MNGLAARAAQESLTLVAVSAEFDDGVLQSLIDVCTSGPSRDLDLALAKFLVGSEVRA